MQVKTMTSAIAKTLLSSAALAAVGVGVAQAQTDQIIVTATKRPQTLQEVPVAVSVVTADTIQDAQILDIIDLQASIPSLRVTQQQNSSQTNFVIRGFGSGANNPGIEPSVGVFVDGVYRSRAAAAILDLPTLERVEVLRGPQSTLFGKNVSIGAISLTTQLPSFDWEGSVEATAGNLNTRQFRGTLSGPISDTLAFRVSGSINNRDGTYTNLVTGANNLNERDRWAVRGQLLWEPTDTLSFRVIGDYNKIDEVCCGTVALINGPITEGVIGLALGGVVAPDGVPGDRISAVNQDPVNELVGQGISLQADWDLGFATLTSITSYREQDDFNNTDVDFTSIDLSVRPQDQNYETFTQEVRLAGEFETDVGVFNWIGGGFLFNEQVFSSQSILFGDDFRQFGQVQLMAPPLNTSFEEIEGATQLIGSLVAGSPLTGPALFPEFSPMGGPTVIGNNAGFASGTGFTGDFELDNRAYSVFFQTDWEVTDRLTLTGGVAYNYDRKETSGDVIQTEPFQNTDLSQFATSGTSLLAAGILYDLLSPAIMSPEEGVLALFADPTAFFTTVGMAAMGDPMGFAMARDGASAGAAASVMADPTTNPVIGFTGLTSLQFIPPQTSWPVGTARDDEISLLDDGFATDDTVNVTARIAYDLTDGLNVYFNYGTGYIAPAVNLSQDAQPPAIGPDGRAVGRFAGASDVRVFEFGAKARFDGGYINIALFDQEVDDFQSNVFVGTGFILANAGKQSVRGFEVEASYSPVDPMNLFFGLTYLDPEYDEFVGAPCPSSGVRGFSGTDISASPGFISDDILACVTAGEATVDLSGTDPSGIHPISISTSASYAFDLGGGTTATPRVEYLFESATDLFDGGGPNVPQREVSQINANLAIEMENGLSVNFWGRNLNNDDALITIFPGVAQTGTLQGYVTPPRQWGATIRKQF
ncbi:MAG: TonB-dependent receptor [Pseudomonadota bacterium]